jgi:hypothetical protein
MLVITDIEFIVLPKTTAPASIAHAPKMTWQTKSFPRELFTTQPIVLGVIDLIELELE